MQFKNIALAAFSFLCLVGALATAALGRSDARAQGNPICEPIAVVGAGQTAIFSRDKVVYIYDRDYLTLYEVNTDTQPGPDKGYPTIRTKLR